MICIWIFWLVKALIRLEVVPLGSILGSSVMGIRGWSELCALLAWLHLPCGERIEIYNNGIMIIIMYSNLTCVYLLRMYFWENRVLTALWLPSWVGIYWSNANIGDYSLQILNEFPSCFNSCNCQVLRRMKAIETLIAQVYWLSIQLILVCAVVYNVYSCCK